MTTPTPFNAWYDSRKHLDDAIQRYLEHSQALETAVIHREDNTLGRGALDELFAKVRKEQASLNPRSEKLKRASVALNRVHNQFTVFVPIRSLPGDVLVHIIALACNKCRFFPTPERPISKCRITKTMLAVTHVCADWRRLAINTPMLWTHLDIVDKGPDARGEGEWETMWLKRAGSVPLSVQVAIQHNVRDRYTKGALEYLVPRLGNVRSLGLHANSRHTLQAALAYWMSNGTPGSVQELFLTGPFEALLRSGSVEFVGHPSLDPAVLSSFLIPIRVLRLKHIPISYSSEVYQELVHLELSSIPSRVCPSAFVLGSLLSASPGLRILKLEKLRVDSSDDLPLRGVELNALERIDLVELTPDACSTILPMLNPGRGRLSLRLEAPINPTNAKAVRSLLDRSNIAKLYIRAYPKWTSAVNCLATITNSLRMLAIDFRFSPDDCQPFLKALLPLPKPSGRSTWRRRKLHTLWLIGGAFEIDDIKSIVEAYRIQTVILSIRHWPNGSAAWKELEPIVQSLITEPVSSNTVFADWDARC